MAEKIHPDGKKHNLGYTPYHAMTRDELLVHVHRLHMAAQDLTFMGRMVRSDDPNSLYWLDGSGGRALERGEQAVSAVMNGSIEPDEESRWYFEYAADLLFDGSKEPSVVNGWCKCSGCGMTSRPPGMPGRSTSIAGKSCRAINPCDGTMQPLTWADLEK